MRQCERRLKRMNKNNKNNNSNDNDNNNNNKWMRVLWHKRKISWTNRISWATEIWTSSTQEIIASFPYAHVITCARKRINVWTNEWASEETKKKMKEWMNQPAIECENLKAQFPISDLLLQWYVVVFFRSLSLSLYVTCFQMDSLLLFRHNSVFFSTYNGCVEWLWIQIMLSILKHDRWNNLDSLESIGEKKSRFWSKEQEIFLYT